jgi:predicted O-methyltransferase YrrM
VPSNEHAALETFGLDAALEIPGWMTERELRWLASRAARADTIIEVGSFLGRSTRILCENCPGIVYAVDDWRGPRDMKMEFSQQLNRQQRIAFLYDNFRKNLVGCDNLCAVVARHENPEFDSVIQADLIFIDGSHKYSHVLRDIAYWRQFLKPEGLLCGHDSHSEDVMRAVYESFPEAKLVEGTTIWTA